MATIVLHAGRPKTGSTSIQRWLVDNRARLRRDHGIEVLVATRRGDGPEVDSYRLEPYESGSVNSSAMVEAWRKAKWPRAPIDRFFEELGRAADRSLVVVVTAEAFSLPLWRLEETAIRGLESLGLDHEIRIAYYVRPQHTAIEANWREAAYKQREHPPSQWVAVEARRLNYLGTLEAVEEALPEVTFGLRPFLVGLLDDGSPVRDFTRRFLSLDEPDTDVHANPGLPLELVNLLRHAPDGWFWTSIHEERYPREQVAEVFDGLALVESSKVRRSRLILQQHCHDVFAHDNRELARRLGWPIADFVPPAEGLDGGWDLSELDMLWTPDATEAECRLLYQALRTALR